MIGMSAGRRGTLAASLCLLFAVDAHAAVQTFSQSLPTVTFEGGPFEQDYFNAVGGTLTGSLIGVNWRAFSNTLKTNDEYSNANFSDGYQADNHVVCGGAPCSLNNGAAVAAASAAVDANGVHAAAYAQTVVSPDILGSSGASASGGAAFGTRVTVDKDTTVSVTTQLDGTLGAFGNEASAGVTVVVEFLTMLVGQDPEQRWVGGRFGGGFATMFEDTQLDGGALSPSFSPMNASSSIDVALSAGDTYLLVLLQASADARDGVATADFSHTLRVSLSAPPDVSVLAEGSFLSAAPVPLPSPMLLTLAPLALLARRRRHG